MQQPKRKPLNYFGGYFGDVFKKYFLFAIDLYKSHPTKFLIADGIRPPLNTLQGIGANAALSIGQVRREGEFILTRRLKERTKITKTAIEILRKHGALDGIRKPANFPYFSLALLYFNAIIEFGPK